MKWVGISGTWRTTNEKVEQDVRQTVRGILAAGDGIVSGGATGVDYFAADEALKVSPDGKGLKVVLPSLFDDYIEHLRAWSSGHDTGDPSVANAEVERLVSQLENLRSVNPAAIIEGPPVRGLDIRQKDYDARDTVVAALATELVAFQVNKSTGTQDTIDKARNAGKKVTVFSYATSHDKAYGKLQPKP